MICLISRPLLIALRHDWYLLKGLLKGFKLALRPWELSKNWWRYDRIKFVTISPCGPGRYSNNDVSEALPSCGELNWDLSKASSYCDLEPMHFTVTITVSCSSPSEALTRCSLWMYNMDELSLFLRMRTSAYSLSNSRDIVSHPLKRFRRGNSDI